MTTDLDALARALSAATPVEGDSLHQLMMRHVAYRELQYLAVNSLGDLIAIARAARELDRVWDENGVPSVATGRAKIALHAALAVTQDAGGAE